MRAKDPTPPHRQAVNPTKPLLPFFASSQLCPLEGGIQTEKSKGVAVNAQVPCNHLASRMASGIVNVYFLSNPFSMGIVCCYSVCLFKAVCGQRTPGKPGIFNNVMNRFNRLI